ncbi:hypothetical protein KC675_01710 [Candidatus Dojkabacteria bacterium]|uniref:Homeodomain phBC6A51-type domain-containing protein n=1 Tax=Candidatus Dojkabacteria bacterium TaxID=2099670 RepID=A0A955I8D9_9BACT|nr:hypothetical protein [Candidatus Dojkabacteria bacterium]
MKTNYKNELIEQLRKTPIIEVACKKTGIGRATFYRWRNKDPKFAEETDLAIQEGSQLVNDMAESQLINAIKDGNLTGIIFWLKNHHRQYSPKLEVTTKNVDLPLTEDQKELIRKSLSMAFANDSSMREEVRDDRK